VALAKAGANVGCHGRHPKPGFACDEIRTLRRKTFYSSADLADSNTYLKLIEKTIAEFGSIDILVNQRRRDSASSRRRVSGWILG